MARRKLYKHSVRNIQKSHGTYYVTLPAGVLRTLKWQERQKVEVKPLGKNRIVISDWKRQRSA